MKLYRTLLLFPVALVTYLGVGTFLYRERVLHHAFWTSSDVTVFGVPLLAVCGAYYCLFWNIRKAPTADSVLALSLVAGFLSFWIYMILILNRYGS